MTCKGVFLLAIEWEICACGEIVIGEALNKIRPKIMFMSADIFNFLKNNGKKNILDLET